MILKTETHTLLQVDDAFVDARSEALKVWWKCEDGPTLVLVRTHRDNIDSFPHLYSVKKPKHKEINTVTIKYEGYYD